MLGRINLVVLVMGTISCVDYSFSCLDDGKNGISLHPRFEHKEEEKEFVCNEKCECHEEGYGTCSNECSKFIKSYCEKFWKTDLESLIVHYQEETQRYAPNQLYWVNSARFKMFQRWREQHQKHSDTSNTYEVRRQILI